MGSISPEQQKKLRDQQSQTDFKKQFNQNLQNNPQYADMMNNIKLQQQQLTAQAGSRPGIAVSEANKFEKEAGVTPPGYEGVRDVKTGQLLDQYKVDPYKGEALQALKSQAFAQGDSPWAKMQLEKQNLEQSGMADQAGKMQAQGLAQAQGNLMRQGGMSSGARTRMAMQGARDLSRSQQDVARQGIGQRLGIQEQDIGRKEDMLKSFGNLETQAQGSDLAQSTGDINRKAMFDMERYKQQMQAWGAGKTADAQKAAAGGGGKK